MTATPSDLLTALLDACRRGEVAHCEAAQLLCIRKQDLGDLVAWRMIEVAVWRAYESAFNRTFPECDARLGRAPVRLDPPPGRPWPMPAECRHYLGSEAVNLPASQSRLFAPLSNAAREFAEPESCDAWENSDGFEDRPPGHSTRALPRDTGQHPLDLVPLDTSGPEFEFKAA